MKCTAWETVKDRAADRRLQREYGITLEQYNLILKYQDWSCAICSRAASQFKTKLAVDHCHKTGLIRGLLCMTCNRALARFDDDELKLFKAHKYIIIPPAVEVVGTVLTAPGRVGTKKRAKLLKKMAKDDPRRLWSPEKRKAAGLNLKRGLNVR